MVLLNCIRHQHNAARTSYELPAPCRSYSLWAYGAMPRLCILPTARCRTWESIALHQAIAQRGQRGAARLQIALRIGQTVA